MIEDDKCFYKLVQRTNFRELHNSIRFSKVCSLHVFRFVKTKVPASTMFHKTLVTNFVHIIFVHIILLVNQTLAA
jgi:hypothetical protein